MSEQIAVALLFAGAAISAALAAFRASVLPHIEKLALAVALAASAFLLRATEWLGG